jgi:glycosyl transferase family 2
MSIFLTVLAAVSLAAVLLAALVLADGQRRLRTLAEVDPGPAGDLPAVSVLIPARDEELHLERALRSVLEQDLAPAEVIVVDDRSSDRTPEILARLAAQYPALRVIRVDELPPGWLGKNHALHVAAQAAASPLLMSADADVVFDPTVLRRAVTLLERDGLDHVTLAPDVVVPGLALASVVGVFSVVFLLYFRPWKAPDPRSPRFMGIGAFNLMRADVYRKAGGHAVIALRPDDDVMLGKVLKRSGARQEMLIGRGLAAVEWYAGVREFVRGLMKNSFAVLGYSPLRVVCGTMFNALVFLGPVAGVFATDGAALLLNGGAVAVSLVLFGAACHQTSGRWAAGLLYPFGAAVFLYIPWRSMALALSRGGIEWRGTLYPLAELRANRV